MSRIVVLSWGNFVPREGRCWHQVGRDQRCRLIAYSAQDSPAQNNNNDNNNNDYLAHSVNSDKFEKP